MLTLSLMLSAAAVVNAIAGGHVASVWVNESSFFCADGCSFGGVYFGQTGYFCLDSQVVTRLDNKGNQDRHFPYDCLEMEKKHHFKPRPRASGEEPEKCQLRKATNDIRPGICLSFKSPGAGKESVQWAEVEKELKAAAPPKSQKECTEEGSRSFSKCRAESGGFTECDEKAAVAVKSCLGLE